MRQFSLSVFVGSVPQGQICAELGPSFVDRVVIGDDNYSLGCPSSFTSRLVFLPCSFFPMSVVFTSSILNFLSHESFEDLLQNCRDSTHFGSEPPVVSPLPPSADM